MFRPTGFADLEGRRVGLFGVGVEGRAARAALEGRADLVLVDDAPSVSGVLATSDGGLEALATCDVVLKSPGIARRRGDVLALEARGVTVTSALNLWLHDVDRARVVAVTGTKGKSTTTSLIAFLFRALGETSHTLGNFGRPPYDPTLDLSEGWLVLEVSSFQCVDIDVAPGVVVVTALGSDHLDWHGSLEQYHEDKLSLTRAAGAHQTLVADVAALHEQRAHLGGEVRFVEPDDGGIASALGLLGAHNVSNAALALATVSSLSGRRRAPVAARGREVADTYAPLRGRLSVVARETRDDSEWRYVDDGLATSPLPVLAALAVFAGEPLALLAGGFDRGVDYGALALALSSRRAPTTLLWSGGAGQRLAALVGESTTVTSHETATMQEAVDLARAALPAGGVVLFSPGAPSFDRYQGWRQRADDFVASVTRRLGP